MRSTVTAAAIVAATLGMTAPSVAETLSSEEISALISGKTVRLSTPYGLELPLQYRTSGEVSGDVSGFTMARMFAPRETGRWWVEQNRLCQQWPSWYDGKAHCFTIEQTGPDSLSWVRQDGLAGTARITG